MQWLTLRAISYCTMYLILNEISREENLSELKAKYKSSVTWPFSLQLFWRRRRRILTDVVSAVIAHFVIHAYNESQEYFGHLSYVTCMYVI